MARFPWEGALVGCSVGGIDELLEWQDEQGGRTESFKMWTDWGRIGIVVLGGLGIATNFFPRILTPAFQAGTPLVTKTVIKAIRAAGGATARPSMHKAGALRGVGSRMNIQQTAKPGFEGLRTY